MDWSFWDVIWTTFVVFLWITFLIVFFNVVIDIFRSRDISGVMKAVWLIFIIVVPLLGVLIYVIVRGQGMAERGVKQQLEQADRLREAVGDTGGSPADQIARAKELLDSGAIDETEYQALKAKALS
jgi:predicted PurR-regulated permease PerM